MAARLLGKYELRELRAYGAQGEVWKAFDPQLRRYVAIKQLHANLQSDPDFTSRFEREGQFVASLHHPNIVQIYDFQIVNDHKSETRTAYMVMDYINGPTLADYIRNTSRKGQFPAAADIVYIFTAISLAIDYAHEKGMIHRDIKPANIMLDQRSPRRNSIGVPILTDFGISKLQSGDAHTTRVLGTALDLQGDDDDITLQGGDAHTTTVLGTPLYISPEQAQGLVSDKRSDLYSLGIILYEISTGVTPFRGSTSPMAILMQHAYEPPVPPALINSYIPPTLSEVILKSIAKDPDARFPTASVMTIAVAKSFNLPVPPELGKVSSRFSYDVVLSYASEDRFYADALATTLLSHNVKVFYDRYERADLWGKNLYTHLSDVYQNKARYCVMLLSKHYAAKVWTTREREAAQARALREQGEYILPIRLDQTEVPGLLPTVAYLNWKEETIQTIVDLLRQKLNARERE